MRKKIAVFASGYGSNLQALIDFNKKDDLNADIVLVFSNNADAFALKRAEKHGIKAIHIDPGRISGQGRIRKRDHQDP